MKPNGKYFVVHAAFFVACAVGLLSAFGNAQTSHGTFKLPTEARWGKLLLAPGEYEFTVNNDASGRILIVRSRESGWSGMVLSASSSDMQFADGTKLLLAKSQEDLYVSALCLGDSGVVLHYRMPEAGKITRLVKPKPSVVASASGAH
jgi:hypothetical protein